MDVKILQFTNSILQINKPTIISGLSLYIALYILLLGTKNDIQIRNILNLQQDLNSSTIRLISIIKRLKDINVTITNSLFIDTNLKLKNSYINKIKDLGKIKKINMTNSVKSIGIINKYVSIKTNNKVNNILSNNDINNTTKLIIINTINFEAEWDEPFNPSKNKKDIFYGLKSNRIEEYMVNKEIGDYYTNELFQVYEKRYSNDTRFGIIIGYNNNIIINNLDFNRFKKTKVLLYLPKFERDERIDIANTIQNLGVINIFNSNYLQNISDYPLYVTKIIHQAKIKVHELGTEASAATAIIIDKEFIPIKEEIVELKANHIFTWYIRDTLKNIILFSGIYK